MQRSSKAKDGNTNNVGKAIIHLLDTTLFHFVLVSIDGNQRHLSWSDVRTYAEAGMFKTYKRVNPSVYIVTF